MMISRLFRTPTSPGKIPVTDAHVAPEKDGMGILIRKIVRKRPRQTPPFQSKSHENEGNPNVDVPKDPEGSGNRDTTDNTDESGNESEPATTTFADTKPGVSGTPKDESPYVPRPGDVCVIRYDCYLLSPLEMDRDRHGRLRISESQQFQNRKRTWVEGNLDKQQQLPPFSTKTTTHPSPANDANDMDSNNYNDTDQTGPPYSSNFHEDPYYDGEKSDRCPLQLPALEFEVGHGDVIRGLEVVVQRMAQGEVVEATIPHLYAYGYKGLYPRIPPKTDLLFVVQLERVIPSASNLQKGFDEPHTATRRTIAFSQDLALFCCGLFEGTFMVLFGIAIPVFLLLRSELDLEEIIQELVGAPNHG